MRKFNVDWKELNVALGYANAVLNDKGVSDKEKNIIFHCISNEEVRVIGYNQTIFSRTEMPITVDDGVDVTGWMFKVKATELNKKLATYSKPKMTYVSGVSIEELSNKVKLNISEEPLTAEELGMELSEDALDKLRKVGSFALNEAPIMDKIKNDISEELEDTDDEVDADLLKQYINYLYPLMSNSNGVDSKLNFTEDYIFVLCSALSSFTINNLPEAFNNLTLGYTAVGFVGRLCGACEGTLQINNLDRYLVLSEPKIGNLTTTVFIRKMSVNVKHSMYTKNLNTDNGIVVYRNYMKDVLSRVASEDAISSVAIEGDDIVFRNAESVHSVPINNLKGDVSGIQFKPSVSVISQAILGPDDISTPEIFMYFIKSRSGYMLYLKDSTGIWFSVTQVK